MSETVAEIREQIAVLQARERELLEKEVEGVVERIKVAISHYGLTPERLFGNAVAHRAISVTPTSTPTVQGTGAQSVSPTARKSLKGLKISIKYRDDQGNTWSGRGSHPRWLRTALESGKSLSNFAV